MVKQSSPILYQIDARNKETIKPNIKSLLDYLKDTAIKNSMVKSQRNKFTEPLKRFSLYLFIIGGRLLYESLYTT